MSTGDIVVIFVLALILFGPKKLPELARQLGKLVAEFRRASNEFRFQMEEELRMAEQADSQRKLAAAQTPADGATTAIAAGTELSIMPPATGLPVGAGADSPASEYEDAASGQGGGEGGGDLPVEHASSQLSALLGPPSQADAVSMAEIPLDAWGDPLPVAREQAPDQAVEIPQPPMRRTSERGFELAEESHQASGEGPFDAPQTAAGASAQAPLEAAAPTAAKEEEMQQEVHTTNG